MRRSDVTFETVAHVHRAVWRNASLFQRGIAYYQLRCYRAALDDYASAHDLDPASASADNALAWVLATCPDASLRDGPRALEAARRACERAGWKNPFFLGTLAASCAETGDFKAAVEWQKKALEFADLYGPEETTRARQRLKLYESRHPHRDPT